MSRRIEAVYDINDWIAEDPDWHALVTRLGQESGQIFYPVQQDPQGGFPYVRYATRTDVFANTSWMHSEQVSYAMYFNNVEDSAEAMNIVMDKVKGGDESATELNKWLSQSGHEVVFDFKTMEWISGGHTDPTGERGGAHARMMNFSVDYTPLYRHMTKTVS